MKNSIVLFLSLALAAFIAGCVTTPKGILVSAQRDPAFSPAKTNTICLAIQSNPSRENAALGSALLAEMSRENFNIVTNTDADYTLAFLIEDDSTSEIVPRAEHSYNPDLPPTPAISGGRFTPLNYENEQPGEPSMQTAIVETEYVHPNKGIRIYLYANPKKHPGLQIAWQGCIEAGETVLPDREPLLIQTLLSYFGQDYTGRIDLK